jgi:hypothetical protein
MGEDDHKAKGMLQRFGDRRRARLAADSAMSFKKFMTKMFAITVSLLFDSLVIPSIFQSFGLLTRGFAVPIGLAIIAAVALQVAFISRIK